MVLPLLSTDLFTIMQAVQQERLSEVPVTFKNECACCVVMASNGYPQKYETGFPLTIPASLPHGAEVFVAGAKLQDGQLVTAGGRVLGVTATAPDLKTAIHNAYGATEAIHFANAYKRTDIGQRALAAGKED